MGVDLIISEFSLLVAGLHYLCSRGCSTNTFVICSLINSASHPIPLELQITFSPDNIFMEKKIFFHGQGPWSSCGINCSHTSKKMNVFLFNGKHFRPFGTSTHAKSCGICWAESMDYSTLRHCGTCKLTLKSPKTSTRRPQTPDKAIGSLCCQSHKQEVLKKSTWKCWRNLNINISTYQY